MKFAIATALLGASVAAEEGEEEITVVVPKTFKEHYEAGWNLIKDAEHSLKPKFKKNDK